jgi:hypothetical protein
VVVVAACQINRTEAAVARFLSAISAEQSPPAYLCWMRFLLILKVDKVWATVDPMRRRGVYNVGL